MYLGNQINRDRQTHMALYTLFRTEFNNHTLCPAAYLRIGHIREYLHGRSKQVCCALPD